MIPKPIQSKGLWNKIKEVFNREYELISNLDWRSPDGEAIETLLIAYHQIIAEEDARIQKEMDKNTSKD